MTVKGQVLGDFFIVQRENIMFMSSLKSGFCL